ncbi:hypothetical protein QT982_17930 [Microcoleus sp. herbarium2]
MSEKVRDGSLATKFGCIPADKRNSAAIGSTPINSARVTGCVGLKVPFLSPLTILFAQIELLWHSSGKDQLRYRDG